MMTNFDAAKQLIQSYVNHLHIYEDDEPTLDSIVKAIFALANYDPFDGEA